MKIDGSCHCGKITLTAEVDPTTAMVCHCTDCQILGGGPCRTGIRSEAEKITIEGDVTEYTKVAESGRKRVQGFCGVCGTSLYAADADKQKNLIFVLASSINVISWCHPNISSVILQLVGSSRLNSTSGLQECLE